MLLRNQWSLILVCLVLVGVITWISRYYKRIANRARVAEERRRSVVSRLARDEPPEAVLALLTRSLHASFSRIRCHFIPAAPLYSEDPPTEQTSGATFPIVDTKGSLLGALTIGLEMADLTHEEALAVSEARQLAAMIAEQQLIYNELKVLAKEDRLTGLMNASQFDASLINLMEASKPETRLALFVFECPGYKHICDRLGYAASDIYLQQAAETIESCFRAGDLVARREGNGFIALAAGLSFTEASKVCQSVVDAFNTPVNIDGLRITTSVHIGVTSFPQGGRNPVELGLSAAAALADARRKTESAFSISSHALRERARVLVSTDHLIRQSLEDNHFDLFYQPQLLLNGEWAGLEALVRLRDPEQRSSPESLATGIGACILPEALRQYEEWLRKGLGPVRIAVKHSQLHLEYSDILTQIVSYLKTFELTPEAIQIELTGISPELADERSLTALWRLRSAGISIVLDVVGRGDLSPRCLNGVPVDAIKINQACVGALREGTDSMPGIAAVIASAHALRMKVTAEGVETEEQMWLLRRLGCDILQGTHMAPPLNATDAGTALGLRLKTEKAPAVSQRRVCQ